ncbi:hypothetical protein ACLOJK_027813 [Asimina triloba]
MSPVAPSPAQSSVSIRSVKGDAYLFVSLSFCLFLCLTLSLSVYLSVSVSLSLCCSSNCSAQASVSLSLFGLVCLCVPLCLCLPSPIRSPRHLCSAPSLPPLPSTLRFFSGLILSGSDLRLWRHPLRLRALSPLAPSLD